MREFQVPDFRSVAFAGAAWLAGIALLLVVPFSGYSTLGDLLGRELIGGVMLLAAGYLFRAGLTDAADTNSRALVREAVRRIERRRRAA